MHGKSTITLKNLFLKKKKLNFVLILTKQYRLYIFEEKLKFLSFLFWEQKEEQRKVKTKRNTNS